MKSLRSLSISPYSSHPARTSYERKQTETTATLFFRKLSNCFPPPPPVQQHMLPLIVSVQQQAVLLLDVSVVPKLTFAAPKRIFSTVVEYVLPQTCLLLQCLCYPWTSVFCNSRQLCPPPPPKENRPKLSLNHSKHARGGGFPVLHVKHVGCPW